MNVIYGCLILELKRLHSLELSLWIAVGHDRMSNAGVCPTAEMSRLSTKEDPVIEHHEQRV